jgi:hypothetical protein
MFASPTMHHTVDPQLQMHGQGMADQSIPQLNMPAHNQGNWGNGVPNMMGAGLDMGGVESDRWSNSSIGNAPVAPTTLNVEDWFQFFGINGENQAIGIDA